MLAHRLSLRSAKPAVHVLCRPQHSRGRVTRSVMASSAVENKVVVVTGANRGLGLEWTKQLLAKGNKVIATCRDPSKASDLNQVGVAGVLKLDVSDPMSIQEWAAELARHVDHIDVVINNAGVYGPKGLTLDSVKSEDMAFTFQTNAIGPLLVVQQLLRHKLIGKPGSIIGNVTSKVGSVADNGSGGSYAYRASKSALNNVNKSLSIDLEDNQITCVLLHPGWVKTDMTNNSGLINTQTSVAGLLSLLESNLPLNGNWYDYKHEAIPW